MAHLTVSVEYGLHSLLWLASVRDRPLSTRELAEFQAISPSFLAKIFPKLEKAGIVHATEGVRGGYRLARDPEEITFLEVIDAIEGDKPLFDCKDIRGKCVMFGDAPPSWATNGVCSIHAVMLRAEKAMRAELARSSIADVGRAVAGKAPPEFSAELNGWLGSELSNRGGRRAVGDGGPQAKEASR